jgi:hypothetical protein
VKLLALFALLLAACAGMPREEAAQRLSRVQGITVDEAVAKWGRPDTDANVANRRVLTWRSGTAGSGASIGTGIFGGSGNVGMGVGTSIPISRASCVMSWEVLPGERIGNLEVAGSGCGGYAEKV